MQPEIITHNLRQVRVNGETVETEATTLSELLETLGYGGTRVATAVNGEFVPERHRATQALADQDRIEIVASREGG